MDLRKFFSAFGLGENTCLLQPALKTLHPAFKDSKPLSSILIPIWWYKSLNWLNILPVTFSRILSKPCLFQVLFFRRSDHKN